MRQRGAHDLDLLLLRNDDLLCEAPKRLVAPGPQLCLCHLDRADVMRDHHGRKIGINIACGLRVHPRHRRMTLGEEPRALAVALRKKEAAAASVITVATNHFVCAYLRFIHPFLLSRQYICIKQECAALRRHLCTVLAFRRALAEVEIHGQSSDHARGDDERNPHSKRSH